MNINEWIDTYHSMIVEPIKKYSGLSGFQLTNGMRIYFGDDSLTDKSKSTMKRHWERQREKNRVRKI